jgi:hypothetical protein
MTPDTCPHCGAPKRWPSCAGMEYQCGSWAASNGAKVQSPECARYVRTRISQLKRMSTASALHDAFRRHCEWSMLRRPTIESHELDPWEKLVRFRQRCLREIDQLRGGA